MNASWYWARASWRRVARGGGLLALLVALGVGGAMGAAAGARRTSTAVERLAAQSNVPQLFVFASDAEVFEEIVDRPGVGAASGYLQLGLQPTGVPCTDAESAYFQVHVPTAGESFAAPRPRLVKGRHADRAAAAEAVVSEQHARRLGIGVGDTIAYRAFDIREDEISGCLDETLAEVRVVGIIRELLEIGAGDEPTLAATYLTPAFVEAHPDAPVISFAGVGGFVHLDNEIGVEAFIDSVNETSPRDEEGEALGGAVRIDGANPLDPAVDALAVGLWALAAVLAVATAVTGGVAVLRQAGTAAPELRLLSALGLTRRRLAVAAVVPVVLALGVGLPLAVVVAAALSKVHLVGIAAVVEPKPGFDLDAAVLVAGTVVAAALGAAMTVLAGWREAVKAARPRTSGGGGRPGTIDGLLRRRAAPWAALGASYALGPPRPGRDALPSRTSVVAVGAATAGILAVLVFGVGVGRASDDPSVYGWGDWDAWAGPAGDEGPGSEIDPTAVVLGDPEAATVADLSVRFKLPINGETVSGTVVDHQRGRSGPTVVDGRLPFGRDEIGLGSDTAERLDVGLGSTVEVSGPDRSRTVEVVGIAAFPGVDGGALSAGFVADREAVTALGWPSGCNDESECINTVALSWRDDSEVAGAVRRLARANVEVDPASPGKEVALVDEADRVPGFGAAGVAVVAAVSLAHTLSVTVTRRRRELAVVRALGFDRRQTAAVVVTEALVLALVGGVLGAMVGVAAGRKAWLGAARAIGIGPALPSVTGLAAAVVGAVVVLALVLSSAPALRAVRTSPAVGLRSQE